LNNTLNEWLQLILAFPANTELLQNLDRNFKDLKTNVENMHKGLKGNVKQAYDTSIAQFKTQCEEIIKKFNFLPPDAHTKALENLNTMYNTTISDLDKRHNSLISDLDKVL